MLVFDQLKRNDPPLRTLALVVLAGMLVLFAGLWWVQIATARNYQQTLETQSFRSVRVPAVRGKILDRHGLVLAENRPSFNISLYLEELRKLFDEAYAAEATAIRKQRASLITEREKHLGRGLTKAERRAYSLTVAERDALRSKAAFTVSSNVVAQIGAGLQQPLVLNATEFNRHFTKRLALPYPVVEKLDPTNVARFTEQSLGVLGADLEVQSVRFYPGQTTAAHLLGSLTRDDTSYLGEEASPYYRLPDFRGLVGLEAGFDAELRGRAGAEYVLVNNRGYKQSETWSPGEPGRNLVLTIDLRIQQAAERALARAQANVRGAIVVMNATNGDVLALVSAPAPDPNMFTRRITQAEADWLNDPHLRPQINRATQEKYAPGSIFKPVVALACLENGLNPNALFTVQPNPANPAKSMIKVGNRPFHGLEPPGDYDFRRALLRSSNCYFITNGIRYGIEHIVAMSQRLHLGERFELPTRQETGGDFPKLSRVKSSAWRDGDTANICIGQGPIAVTPLQMAVVTAAIANGGRVFWPRLVDRLESPDAPLGNTTHFPPGRLRSELGVSARSLHMLKEAMLADTEDAEATAYKAFREYYREPGVMRVCGKTGTAEVKDTQNRLTGQITWFISFAPYDDPRYVVVAMVEDGGSGGGTCAPVVRDIYTAIGKLERGNTAMLANSN